MKQLTDKQNAVFQYIKDRSLRGELPPTRLQIKEQFGYKSVTSVSSVLDFLTKKGVIEILPGTARGIRLVHQLDDCSFCRGEKGGVKGNENQYGPLLYCDHCHADGTLDSFIKNVKRDFYGRTTLKATA